MVYGYALTGPDRDHNGHPVPALVVRGEETSESSARVSYFSVRDGKLRFCFRMDTSLTPIEPALEATFISNVNSRPLFSAPATVSVDSDYRIETELSAEATRDWNQLKVTDRMPFRLILCSARMAE